MTRNNIEDILCALDDLFQREKEVLLSGQIDLLPPLLAQKTQLVDQLQNAGGDRRQDMQGLRQKAAENQVLLEQAGDGLRRVARRIADFQKLTHSFDTYDSRGHKRTIDGQVPRHVEKRA